LADNRSSRAPFDLTPSGLFVPQSTRNAFEIRFDRLLHSIGAYWDANGIALLNALTVDDGYSIVLPLRGSISADLSAAVRRLGVYFDSILIVDPLHIPSGRRSTEIDDPEFTGRRLTLAHRLSFLLRLEPLLSRDVDENIFVVIPDWGDTQPQTEAVGRFMERLVSRSSSTVSAATEEDQPTILDRHLWDLVCERFSSNNQLQMGMSVGSGLSAVGRDSLLLRTSDQFHSSDLNTAEAIARQIDNALYVFCETTLAGIVTGADPVVYGPDSFIADWYRRDISRDRPNDLESQATSQALLHPRMDFLEAVSIEALTRIRAEGVFEDLRRQLRVDRSTLRQSLISDARLYEEAFLSHLFACLDEYGGRISALETRHRSQVRRAGAGLGVTVGLGALSLLVPPLVVFQAIAAGTSLLVGGKTVVDIVSLRRAQGHERHELESSPIGLLFEARASSTTATR